MLHAWSSRLIANCAFLLHVKTIFELSHSYQLIIFVDTCSFLLLCEIDGLPPYTYTVHVKIKGLISGIFEVIQTFMVSVVWDPECYNFHTFAFFAYVNTHVIYKLVKQTDLLYSVLKTKCSNQNHFRKKLTDIIHVSDAERNHCCVYMTYMYFVIRVFCFFFFYLSTDFCLVNVAAVLWHSHSAKEPVRL